MVLGFEGGPVERHDKKPLILSLDEASSCETDGEDGPVVPKPTLQMDFSSSLLLRSHLSQRAYRIHTNGTGRYTPYKLDKSRCQAINPSKSRFLVAWDAMIAISLMIVAFVAPFEAAFLTLMDKPPKSLFLFDRCIDVLFIIDIGLQFIIMRPDPKRPSHYIRKPSMIAKLYIKDAFFWDLMSVLPGDGMMMITGQKETALAPLFRLLRLLRLQRWHQMLQRWKSSFGISYAMLTVIEFCVGTVLCCHWAACLWGGCGVSGIKRMLLEPDYPNWINAVIVGKGSPPDYFQQPFNVYVASLYWATMTCTGVGYGDIVAYNTEEYVVATLCIAIMAAIWAYVVGAICTVLSTLNPENTGFKQTMDELNRIMEERNMPSDFRRSLRTYLTESQEVQKKRSEQALVGQLSPMLQGEISMLVHQKWLNKVWYLNNLDMEVIVEISRRLESNVFVPGEHIATPRTLFVVERGVCARGGKIKMCGDLWGEDIIIDNPKLLDSTTARALSYAEVLMLSRQSLNQAVEDLPDMVMQLRRAQVMLAVVRGVVKLSQLVIECLAKEVGADAAEKWTNMSSEERFQLMEVAGSVLAGSGNVSGLGHDKSIHSLKAGATSRSSETSGKTDNEPLLKALVDKVEQLSNKFDKRFDDVVGRVDTLSDRVGKVEGAVNDMAGKVNDTWLRR